MNNIYELLEDLIDQGFDPEEALEELWENGDEELGFLRMQEDE